MTEVPWRLTKSLYAKKGRLSSSLTIAEGPPSVVSALEAGVEVEFMVVSRSFAESSVYARVEKALGGKVPGFPMHVVPDDLFERMSELRSPVGILCVLPFPFRYPSGPPASPWKEPLYLYGFDIQDPGNAGTLVRAAAATGVSALVFCGESADVFSPKCIRSSAGAAFKVNLEERDPELDPVEILAGLERSGVAVYKAAPRAGLAPWQAPLRRPSAVVVGNEARGLPAAVLDGPGKTITIPMPGDTESLNVAVASGMLLYEAVRQRLLSDPQS